MNARLIKGGEIKEIKSGGSETLKCGRESPENKVVSDATKGHERRDKSGGRENRVTKYKTRGGRRPNVDEKIFNETKYTRRQGRYHTWKGGVQIRRGTR